MNETMIENMSIDELIHYAPRGESAWIDALVRELETTRNDLSELRRLWSEFVCG